MAYSAITSLAEADMALAFEYDLDTTYSFNTDFQKQLANYLAAEYMDYINAKELTVEESKVGFDLNDDGDTEDTIDLTIEYDENGHAETFINGWYAKGSTGGNSDGIMGGPGGGGFPGGDHAGGPPSGEAPDGAGPGGKNAGGPPDMNEGMSEEVGTPDSGTTQSSTGKTDSTNYCFPR